MIQVNNVSLKFGKRILFEDVNIKFTEGNCYGLIGANGSGKSTFLKLLSGEIETTTGEIVISKNERLSILRQDHYQYDNNRVIDVVIMGNDKLYKIMEEKNKMYEQTEFSEEDGMKLANLEAEFMDLDGWNAESDACTLLNNLGIDEKYHYVLMSELAVKDRVKVLLAQALFGNPDILLLDEPTNSLDLDAIRWLEEFLINFNNTVILVSHDRHFLNKVCTHIADIDYGKIKLYVGNYDFWYESSELLQKQMRESNKKKEEKIKELQAFIARFSANASKSKQATSRKKMLDKIQLDEIVPSSRKYPYIDFKIEKPAGKEILKVENLTKVVDGKKILNKVSFTVLKGDKITFIANNDMIKTTLFNILTGKEKYDAGTIEFGKTINYAYLPQDNTEYFNVDKNIMEWIGQYYDIKDETVLRGFLGRMLFSGDDVFKKVSVLSGGEKMRCMLSKLMLEGPNFLILDEPTNHLDLESITSLNKGLINFQGEVLFTSRDYELNSTVTNRVIEILDDGSIIDRCVPYEEYIESKSKR
ncbi:MAG: ATP-binding cassette domain-containing protein [Bacilli bacterium]|nr:ATP-binding cassette domain-containing protein [Mycoplasmatota bacterium]MDD6264345.1 ATP-binding cassette domain-containing protein [bacterium]MDY2697023.1 ATP-binding cassette domain-containing protein [Bacilli bacterium]MDD6941135.1 ATP-binding cassette domain-containing protein [bacterium]MDY5993073.1 ATP-binding cassette domain-containing protein [Bacilli bacterium]